MKQVQVSDNLSLNVMNQVFQLPAEGSVCANSLPVNNNITAIESNFFINEKFLYKNI